MKGSLIILLFFALGVFLGYKTWLPEVLLTTDFSSYALYVLMFLVGISMGVDVKAFKALKHMKLKIVAIPITTIVGTAIGVAVVWFLLSDILLKDAWAIGAGYGYYSLSSIYISEVRGETLGVIALLSNVIREIITLVAAPLMVKWFGKLAPIVSGGATSMDTTLPIISQTSGTEYAIVSVFHGTVLTILVPVLVTFFMGL